MRVGILCTIVQVPKFHLPWASTVSSTWLLRSLTREEGKGSTLISQPRALTIAPAHLLLAPTDVRGSEAYISYTLGRGMRWFGEHTALSLSHQERPDTSLQDTHVT